MSLIKYFPMKFGSSEFKMSIDDVQPRITVGNQRYRLTLSLRQIDGGRRVKYNVYGYTNQEALMAEMGAESIEDLVGKEVVGFNVNNPSSEWPIFNK